MDKSIVDIWRRKSDVELLQAADELQDYRSDVRQIIVAELVRRQLREPAAVEQLRPSIPSKQQLLNALNMTEADLQMNRAGVLTPKQQTELKQATKSDARWMLGLAVVLAVVMYGILYLIVQDGRVLDMRRGIKWTQLMILGVTLVLPTAALFYAGYTARIYQRSRRAQTVMVIKGEVELQRDYLRGGAVLYWLIIGRFKFAVNQAVYQALRNGHLCRVYYEPTTKVIVAIEPVDPEPLL